MTTACQGCGELPCCCLQMAEEMQAYWNYIGAVEAEEEADARELQLWLEEIHNRTAASWDQEAVERVGEG